ncbi:unnamed protein product, partial [Ilex paraguariensis]
LMWKAIFSQFSSRQKGYSEERFKEYHGTCHEENLWHALQVHRERKKKGAGRRESAEKVMVGVLYEKTDFRK